jgi:hypothetical protein
MRQLDGVFLTYDRSRSIDWQKTPQEGLHVSCPERRAAVIESECSITNLPLRVAGYGNERK